MIEHQMEYRAGRVGLEGIGLPDVDPHWRCTCATGWTFEAKEMHSRKTGNNQIEAERAHSRHAGAVR